MLLLIVIVTIFSAIAINIKKHASVEEIARIYGPEDLVKCKVATKADTPSVETLQGYLAKPVPAATIEAAFERVSAGKAVAVAHDAAILQYVINRDGLPFMLVGRPFAHQRYGVIFRPDLGTDFVRRFNLALQESLEDETTGRLVESYLR